MHPQKHPCPIDVTDEGIVILINFEQLLNAFSPIDVTDEGIVIFSNKLQQLKVKSLINLTEDDIVISVKEEHLPKQL